MSPVPKEVMDQIKNEIHTVLGKSASELFLHRVDAILEGWSMEKLTAAQACEKIQKLVALFIDEDKAREIGWRCAPVIMKESASKNK